MIPSREQMQKALCERHGTKMQERFNNAKVTICGLGGLGSNIAIALARAGVGHLHLIDFDKVDISNLNRQQYFTDQLDMYKTDAMKENLARIAPYVEVTCECMKITEDVIPGLFDDADIICEAFDRPEAKAMLVNGVLCEYPDKKIVSGSGMAGLDSANKIHTRKVMKNFYLCGDEEADSCMGLSLVSARVLVCAAHEATMILRLIAGETEV
ncbi:sulfur carrier protein ThiS adenylyltransferase ThiF [Falcatimonas sp. MSJ-15]|uniref:sulfur carrier protein ThiS adenylyltransferase ThiF n=1 Tax=Falcatimonas sp. MSJ-15 TaxID=2841515 RepID=UPI001C121565|nr:sulfur carrier protein ThiS adenylyltransferase ThiF [Falcatimonas sp. MSJ-15]MBU5470967.1 sulfur carrier protein ThiS adenylyltransferase ThiF [Falcatimonas sp. MSJ-15]